MSTNIADAVPRLKRLIPRLRGKRIGVLGDLMLTATSGDGFATFAGSGRSRGGFRGAKRVPGGAGNVSANIAALGARVEAFWGYGNDSPGALCKNVFAPRTSVTKAPVRLADLRRQGEAPAARRVQDPAGDKTRRQHASRIGFCSRRRECGSCVEEIQNYNAAVRTDIPVQSERQGRAAHRRPRGAEVELGEYHRHAAFEAYAVTCGLPSPLVGCGSIAARR